MINQIIKKSALFEFRKGLLDSHNCKMKVLLNFISELNEMKLKNDKKNSAGCSGGTTYFKCFKASLFPI